MGDCTDRYAFTAFGELLSHEGEDPNAYLFAGEMLDPNSGFYYNRARWMDPGVGRFVSADIFSGLEHEPASLHKYLYSASNPQNRIDPTGLYSVGQLVVAAAIVGAIAAVVIFKPQGVLETVRVALAGAVVGAALAYIMLWWATAGLAASAGTAAGVAAGAGAGAAPIIHASRLQLPRVADAERIWLGHYGGRGLYLDGQTITGVYEPGKAWLQAMAARFGGHILEHINRRNWPAFQAAIDRAKHIVFNISHIQPGTLTEREYLYIRSSPELMAKTTWVTNATF